VDSDSAAARRRSVVRVVPAVQPRKLAKVPFVELADGRLQGVVSSGSDIARVYVSSITAVSHDFSCSTNNNRPCGGAGYSMCNHLRALVEQAGMQYGIARVARYLRVELEDDNLIGKLRGQRQSTPAAGVFARFLRHLAYLEVPETTEPIVEMDWFPTPGVTG
jgi:hypothetical protein